MNETKEQAQIRLQEQIDEAKKFNDQVDETSKLKAYADAEQLRRETDRAQTLLETCKLREQLAWALFREAELKETVKRLQSMPPSYRRSSPTLVQTLLDAIDECGFETPSIPAIMKVLEARKKFD